MGSLRQPEILIAHPWMDRGGSEATAMWVLHALQNLTKETFATASPVDWDSLNAAYGTRVDPEKIVVLQAPRLPGVNSGRALAFWQRAYFERFFRFLAWSRVFSRHSNRRLCPWCYCGKDFVRKEEGISAKWQISRLFLRGCLHFSR